MAGINTAAIPTGGQPVRAQQTQKPQNTASPQSQQTGSKQPMSMGDTLALGMKMLQMLQGGQDGKTAPSPAAQYLKSCGLFQVQSCGQEVKQKDPGGAGGESDYYAALGYDS
jgi:hypothetical protein